MGAQRHRRENVALSQTRSLLFPSRSGIQRASSLRIHRENVRKYRKDEQAPLFNKGGFT